MISLFDSQIQSPINTVKSMKCEIEHFISKGTKESF